MRRSALALLAAFALSLGPLAASGEEACGGGLCAVEGGGYRLAMPEVPVEAPVPALFFLHGWGASSQGTMRSRAAMRAALSARGYALIVPEGVPRAGRTQRDWAVRDGRPHPRDDLALFEAILADAAARGVDRARVLMAGFSRGGSMVWYTACERPEMMRAYAPVAGAFWEPFPKRCAGPVDLFHTHGWTDRVVPVEGRQIGGGRIVQGDAFQSVVLLRTTNGCETRLAEETVVEGEARWLRAWTSCAAGRVDLMLHPGGHTVPEDWIGRALDWFEARLADGAAREVSR